MEKKAFQAVLIVLCLSFFACSKKSSSNNPYHKKISNSSLIEIKNFGENPGDLRFFIHPPKKELKNAPLVFLLHGCKMSAKFYADISGWNELADKNDFYVVYAQTDKTPPGIMPKCFSWFSVSKDSKEALSLKQMIDYTKKNYSVDSTRVFISGISAGSYMSVGMIANYPKLFKAAALLSGGPFGCSSLTSPFNPVACIQGLWNNPKNPSAEKWASLVPKAEEYPKILIFHGEKDKLVNPVNRKALLIQFAKLQKIDLKPDLTKKVGKAVYEEYQNDKKEVLIASYFIKDMGHVLSVDPGDKENQGGKISILSKDYDLYSSYYVAKFFKILKK